MHTEHNHCLSIAGDMLIKAGGGELDLLRQRRSLEGASDEIELVLLLQEGRRGREEVRHRISVESCHGYLLQLTTVMQIIYYILLKLMFKY